MLMEQRRYQRHRALGAFSRIGLAVAIAVSIAGCSGGGDDADETPQATPTPMPTAEPTPSVGLGDVVWSTAIDQAGAPVENLSEIPRDIPVIHAAIEVRNVPVGETLTAAWSLDEAPIDAIATTATIDQASETGWVTFSLAWEGESLWPTGTLGITVTSSSGATSTGTIQILST